MLFFPVPEVLCRLFNGCHTPQPFWCQVVDYSGILRLGWCSPSNSAQGHVGTPDLSMVRLVLCVLVSMFPSVRPAPEVNTNQGLFIWNGVISFWGAIVALQAYWPCHLGFDNLDVARTVGRLLDKDCLVKPLPLVKDGDLVALVQYMIRTGGRETVRVTNVKWHAEDADVQSCRVRLEDQLGNAWADTAADLGRRHQSEVLIGARRRLLKVRSYWYPIMLQLHRFMIAIARVTVNHDGRGGTAPDPLVWDQGGRRKVRRTDIGVDVDHASSWPSWFLGWAMDSSSSEQYFWC